MDSFKENYRFWTSRNRKSLYLGVLLLSLALIIQVYAAQYSYHKAVEAVFADDILLDNLPTVNLDWLIVQGSLVAITLSVILLIFYPHHLLFTMKAVALFAVVRALFMSLTHIGIYPEQAVFRMDVGSKIYNFFNFPGNFFFSGHTGLPFLMALIFWHEKPARFLFLSLSFVFATGVLLAHVHYSIDVFAAPFITYGIFKIAQWFFPGDYFVLAKDYIH